MYRRGGIFILHTMRRGFASMCSGLSFGRPMIGRGVHERREPWQIHRTEAHQAAHDEGAADDAESERWKGGMDSLQRFGPSERTQLLKKGGIWCMYGWASVVKRNRRSLLVGFSLGDDRSCSGRLRFWQGTPMVEFVNLPKKADETPELWNLIHIIEDMFRKGHIAWQRTCVRFRSLKAEDGFQRMMRQIHDEE